MQKLAFACGFLFGFVCVLAALSGCSNAHEEPDPISSTTTVASDLNATQRISRYARIRDVAATKGMTNAYLLAGIAYDETGLAQCWSEATWACQGPSSPDCGGGPVIAGSADGPPSNPCGPKQGGLGIFQFDAGTYSQTLAAYGTSVLTVDGQVSLAIDYVVNMVKISAFTTNAETNDKAREWINRFDPNNATLRDQWIRTVIRHYNGCQNPSWSCWGPRYSSYSQGLSQVLNDTGGSNYWLAGTHCPNSNVIVIGAINTKYQALGGCTSTLLGAPITNELPAANSVGRYTVFERGSIYWTPSTGAHEVHGRIRDAWRDTGWETGPLGYPISDEIADAVGRRSDFEHGHIIWNAATDSTTVF